jgi:hypothetical protein
MRQRKHVSHIARDRGIEDFVIEKYGLLAGGANAVTFATRQCRLPFQTGIMAGM